MIDLKKIINNLMGDFKQKMQKAKHEKYHKISFDASVMKNGDLGIGMYDITGSKKLSQKGKLPRMCSKLGETAALKFTLKYSRNKGYKRLMLFTDNLSLAESNLDDILKDYNFEDVVLNWVPRELNSEADKHSKIAQKDRQLFTGPAANQVVASKTTTKPSNTGLRIVQKSEKTFKIFEQYTMQQKVNMLSNLSDKASEHEQNFIKMLRKQVKADYQFNISNSNIIFIRMARTLLMKDPETSDYVKNRFKKMKNPGNNQMLPDISYEKFEKEFDRRKQNNEGKTA